MLKITFNGCGSNVRSLQAQITWSLEMNLKNTKGTSQYLLILTIYAPMFVVDILHIFPISFVTRTIPLHHHFCQVCCGSRHIDKITRIWALFENKCNIFFDSVIFYKCRTPCLWRDPSKPASCNAYSWYIFLLTIFWVCSIQSALLTPIFIWPTCILDESAKINF